MEKIGRLDAGRIPDDDRLATSLCQSRQSRLFRHGSRETKDIVERDRLVLIGIEPGPAQGGTKEGGMDSDDGSKTAAGTSNKDKVLMLRPRQTLQQLA